MQVKDLSHPKSSASLNEAVASQFGYKLQIDNFTIGQLKEARDVLVNKIAKFEVSKNYNEVFENTEYRKDRMFLDVITQAITERSKSPSEADKKEKYIKGMKKVKGDFTKKYGSKGTAVMHATAAKMAKKKSVSEAMDVLKSVLAERVLTEGEEEKAALIMSSRDMVDRITGWLEDVASLRAEALLELIDSIRDEMGADISVQFNNKVKPSLSEIYDCLEKNRQVLATAVTILTGEEPPHIEGETPAPQPNQGALGAPAGTNLGTDAFGAAAPAAGGTEEAGRAKRESIEFSRRLGTILSSKKN